MHKRPVFTSDMVCKTVSQSRAGYRACRLHCAELSPQRRSKPAEAMAQKMNFVSRGCCRGVLPSNFGIAS